MHEIMNRIEEVRKARKMTGRDLCNQLKIHDTNYIAWKRGRSGYIKHLPEIAQILGCTVEYLTTGQESPGETLYRKYMAASERDRKIIDLILG